MDPADLLRMTWRTISSQRLRSALTMLGIIISIASVVLLTSIGEGVRIYIVTQFTQFGTDLVAVQPGKTDTWGVPGFLGGTTRYLTTSDARALQRITQVKAVMPMAFGTAEVEYLDRGRNVFIYGVTHRMPDVFKVTLQSGMFLPADDYDRPSPVCVLGSTLRRELFGDRNPLGERIRIAGTTLRVIGVMTEKGNFMGIDIDDTAYIPVGLAMSLFNRQELNEIDLKLRSAHDADAVEAEARRILSERRDGDEDFTIVQQKAMLDTFGKILRVITSAVAGIAAISLLVGAVGILTIQWVSVHERTPEIGLSLAIGATRGQVLTMFLAEAAGLSTLGGILGLALGVAGSRAIHAAVPGLPTEIPPEIIGLALVVSFAVGILSGILPAIRAARLDPVDALRAE